MLMKNRREVLAMAAMGALLRRHAGAQQGAPSIMYRDYSRCLPDYLRDLAERAYQSRNRAISALTTRRRSGSGSSGSPRHSGS